MMKKEIGSAHLLQSFEGCNNLTLPSRTHL